MEGRDFKWIYIPAHLDETILVVHWRLHVIGYEELQFLHVLEFLTVPCFDLHYQALWPATSTAVFHKSFLQTSPSPSESCPEPQLSLSAFVSSSNERKGRARKWVPANLFQWLQMCLEECRAVHSRNTKYGNSIHCIWKILTVVWVQFYPKEQKSHFSKRRALEKLEEGLHGAAPTRRERIVVVPPWHISLAAEVNNTVLLWMRLNVSELPSFSPHNMNSWNGLAEIILSQNCFN